MSTKMVQIRDVDAAAVDVLKGRAAASGMSLSEYLKRQVERMAASPTNEEVFARAQQRPRRDLGISAADVVRAVRDEYDA